MAQRVEAFLGDITTLSVDAIVNAANRTLLGGGGVDGAIHQAAGHGLYEECLKLGGCKTGEAKITKGYNLKAKYVIHTVGPIYFSDEQNKPELLANCYRNSMKLAGQKGIRSIAFPAISTGAYNYPLEEACGIAVDEVAKALYLYHKIERVVFCCFDEFTFEVYKRKIAATF